MWKKLIISIIVIVILFAIGFGIFKIVSSNSKETNEITQNDVTNMTNISGKLVNDDCIDEWKDYAKTIEEELKQASNTYDDENAKYVIRNENNIVTIYKINNKKEEVLYKTTNISVNYLTEEDIKLLNQGIEVNGSNELNKMLEDFE